MLGKKFTLNLQKQSYTCIISNVVDWLDMKIAKFRIIDRNGIVTQDLIALFEKGEFYRIYSFYDKMTVHSNEPLPLKEVQNANKE